MTWAIPRTYVAGEVTTATHLNQDARDNFKALVPQAARTDTSETRTLNSYGDLSGGATGPAVTVDTLTAAYVFQSAQMNNSTAGAVSLMAYDITGATSYSAADVDSLQHNSIVASDLYAGTRMTKRDELVAGSNTFTSKYKATSATGTFVYRQIIVIPVGPVG